MQCPGHQMAAWEAGGSHAVVFLSVLMESSTDPQDCNVNKTGRWRSEAKVSCRPRISSEMKKCLHP
jgi:hypothetical protein